MPDLNIRPDVVSLLTGLNLAGNPKDWTHADDGRPITPAELDTALSATFTELEAVLAYGRRAAGHATDQAAAVTRIGEITGPYFAQLPDGARMGDVMPLLDEAETAEILALMALLAPDGTIVTPAGN